MNHLGNNNNCGNKENSHIFMNFVDVIGSTEKLFNIKLWTCDTDTEIYRNKSIHLETVSRLMVGWVGSYECRKLVLYIRHRQPFFWMDSDCIVSFCSDRRGRGVVRRRSKVKEVNKNKISIQYTWHKIKFM